MSKLYRLTESDNYELLIKIKGDNLLKESYTIAGTWSPELFENEDYKEFEKLKEIVLTQKEYIGVLVDELNETIPIAQNHGWITTRFEKGKRLRSKILELTSLI